MKGFWDSLCESVIGEEIAYGESQCIVAAVTSNTQQPPGPQGIVRVASDWFGSDCNENIKRKPIPSPLSHESTSPALSPASSNDADKPETNEDEAVHHTAAFVQMKRVELLEKRIEFLCRRSIQCNASISPNPPAVLDFATTASELLKEFHLERNRVAVKWGEHSEDLGKLEYLQAKLSTSLIEEPNKMAERKRELLEKVRAKRAVVEAEIRNLQQKSEAMTAQQVPDTVQDLCELINHTLGLKRYCKGITEEGLKPWLGQQPPLAPCEKPETTNSTTDGQLASNNRNDREKFLDPSAEESLAVLVTELERRGYPLSKHDVLDIAAEMVHGQLRKDFAENAGDWILGWEQRVNAMGFNVDEILSRGHTKGQTKWFTEENVNWWFDRIKHRMIELGVADDCDCHPGFEIQWKFPSRVLISEELEILGDPLYLSSQQTRKYVQYQKRADPAGPRPKERNKEFRMLAGFNLLYEAHPPVFSMGSANSSESRIKMSKILKPITQNGQGSINGREVSELFLSSPHSALAATEDEWVDNVIEMIRAVYPDVSNRDPSKRVIWFSNGPTKLLFKLAKACRNTGIHLVSTLPHCGSNVGSPLVPYFRSIEKLLFGAVQQLHFGSHRTLNVFQKAELAVKALRKINRYPLFKKGTARSGLRPFHRNLFFDTLYRLRPVPSQQDLKSVASWASPRYSDVESLASSATCDEDRWSIVSDRTISQHEVEFNQPVSLKETMQRLDRVQHKLNKYKFQLETFAHVGTKTYEARVSVANFEASLRKLAAEQEANAQYEAAIRIAEENKKQALAKAKQAYQEELKRAEASKHKYETYMRREVNVVESMQRRLPSVHDVRRMPDTLLKETRLLIAATDQFLRSQKARKRDPETGELLDPRDKETLEDLYKVRPRSVEISRTPIRASSIVLRKRPQSLRSPGHTTSSPGCRSSASSLSPERREPKFLSSASNPNSGAQRLNGRDEEGTEEPCGDENKVPNATKGLLATCPSKSLADSFSRRMVSSVQVEELEALGDF